MLKLLQNVAMIVGSYRCCLTPLGPAAFAVGTCFFVGARLCHIAAGHVGFDLLVAIAAVIVHFSAHETLKRMRLRSRRKS